MHAVEDTQTELPLVRVANSVSVPIEMVRAKKNKGAAFTFACDASGLDDKEIYLPLGIDKAVFSKIKSGSANLDADLIGPFCALVDNTIYPEWIAYQVGATLVVIKSAAERRAEAAERERDAVRAENRLMRQLLQGKATTV